MRLTCPNCGAQYEVPDDVIPEDGRDVQCSNCEETWFQTKNTEAAIAEPEPATKEEPEPEAEPSVPEPTEASKPPAPPQPAEEAANTGNVDPAVANILKEEAAREADLRSREGGSLESQPDLALDPPAEPKVTPKKPQATETARDAGQKDALPDVEAINSGLRSDATETEEPTAPPRKSGGFLRGFALMVIIGVILLLIYSNASQISEAVPQADPVLKSYVSMIDQARIWLEAQTGGAASN